MVEEEGKNELRFQQNHRFPGEYLRVEVDHPSIR